MSLFLWAPRGTHIWFRIFLNAKCRSFEGNYSSRIPIGGTFGDLDIPVKVRDEDFKFLMILEIAEAKVSPSVTWATCTSIRPV